MPAMPTIYIILGSTRDGRFGETVAKWFYSVAARRTDMKVELVDLKEWNLPFFMSAKTPSSGEYHDDLVKKWSEKIAAADGYVIVTAEYNHGYPAPIKNALDHLYHEWKRKPVAFVSYGGAAGGARAAEQLKMVASELHMTAIRESVTVPMVWSAFDERGEPKDPKLNERVTVVLDDLFWWTNALKQAREA